MSDSAFPVVEGIVVDVNGLLSVSHTCTPGLCEASQHCCSYYEICVNEQEVTQIIPFLPSAATYSPQLTTGKAFANIFDEVGKDLYAIDKQDDGTCALAYVGKNRESLCSLHTIALETGVPLRSIKPEPCILWPLALVESDPVVLSIQDDLFSFPCNQQRKDRKRKLDKGVEEIVQYLFGEKFLAELQNKIQ